jgi:uncharacterized BrkB/YihY/UPF0761 family membrane protein
MVWLYWTALAVLLGGEINADLLHTVGKRVPVSKQQHQQRFLVSPTSRRLLARTGMIAYLG